MLPDLCIFDDFLKDPHAARKLAIASVGDPAVNRGNYAGTISARPLPIEGLEATISRLLNVEVKAAPGTSHGHCRLTIRNDRGRSGVHIDPCDYSGILFLNETEGSKGGTDFYRHRRTGLESVPLEAAKVIEAGYSDVNALIEDVVNRDSRFPAKWERTMQVPIRFNRLLLFSPWRFHNAGPGFGTDATNGRLVHLMFFNRVKRTAS